MKLTVAAVLLLAAAASAAGDHFYTNSYRHTDVRAYPAHRQGHNRIPATKTCAESADCSASPRHTRMERMMRLKEEHHEACRAAGECPIRRDALAATPCVGGKAGQYECDGVDLVSFVPISDLGSDREASDSWGWTDPQTGDEIAIIGMEDGTAFVQITPDPANPVVLGFLPMSSDDRPRIWSDMKVFKDHVFIVREVDHGMQVMDLTKLRDFYGSPSSEVRQLEDDAVYREVNSTHNVVINEETGFAYLVGTRTCKGGIHAVDIMNPKEPVYAGCFADDGYVHDAQCVIYDGPDARYVGREICFNYNEDTITIVDVSDKANMKMLSRVTYFDAQYTHQGWLTKDMRFLVSNDELDEMEGVLPYTRTLLWNIEDLEDPYLVGPHYAAETSIDHNLYIRDDLAYLTNYCSGLRILDMTLTDQGIMPEVAFFDAADYCNTVDFLGTWSNYPFFESENIVVSSIELGLFILRPQYDSLNLGDLS